jgi:hypothetical protein
MKENKVIENAIEFLKRPIVSKFSKDATEQDILRNKWEAKHFLTRNQRFENALASEQLQAIQFGNDFKIIADVFTQWESKVPKENPKWKKINFTIGALNRMFFYTHNLETISKSAIAEMLEYKEKYYQKMKVELNLNQKIKELEEEIKFLTKNG